MPITHRGFSAWIKSEGAELTAYNPIVEGRTISCWIPSEEGEKFKVYWKDIIGGVATRGTIYFDGSPKPATATRVMPGTKPGTTTSKAGARLTETTIKPFLFSKLHTTDDESASSSVSPDLGSIRLSIERVIAKKASTPVKVGGRFAKQVPGAVHEKSKKAGSHVISYGDEENTGKRTFTHYKTQPYDPSDTSPWVTFIFRYRPLDLLQANGIAPASTAKTKRNRDKSRKIKSNAGDGGIDDADAEEISALEERLRLLKGKRKLVSDPGTSAKKLKSEETPPIKNELAVEDSEEEVIDLT
ncbi:hypothetical protein BOTBODRAFT_32248 [Botryobasidium botryosum FD-172 SS1]|uniref:DUF7918 domain-containing protein n=1 Tax=Botryobasidium botryosum (strain FD-172 SS1) TaxID=930990 RepID=A0A067MJK4_BOTB1|nr:hypothetical protein BOTBODRAFT_32248 [Botryobasidium botryosum FD-172 SS1]